MKVLLLIFMISFPIYGVDCPGNTDLVEVDLSYSGKKVKFCQKSLNGELVKHGPEEILDLKNNVISKKYFINNVESEFPLEKIEPRELDFCDGEQFYIKKLLKSLFVNDHGVFDHEKEHVIVKSKTGCRAYSGKRLKFFVNGVPYTNPLKFGDQCNFQGDLYFGLDKKIDASISLRGEASYDHLKISYIITKMSKGDKIQLKLNVIDGEFSKKQSINILKFSATQDYEIDTNLLLMSRGKKGVFSDSPIVKIKQLNEKKCP